MNANLTQHVAHALMREDYDQLLSECLKARISLIAEHLDGPLQMSLQLWLSPSGTLLPHLPKSTPDDPAVHLRVLRHTPEDHLKLAERYLAGEDAVDLMCAAYPPFPLLKTSLQQWLAEGNFVHLGANLPVGLRSNLLSWTQGKERRARAAEAAR